MRDYSFPPRGGAPELRSFKVHASRISISDYQPSDAVKHTVIQRVLRDFPRSELPRGFEGNHVSVTRDQIMALYPLLTQSSSPGLPWARLGKTKGEVITKHGDLLADAVLDRLRVLSRHDLQSSDAIALVNSFAVDPVRLFIKQEPHTKEKLSEGRYRLISSCSIVDELVTRLLFTNQNTVELDNWFNVPVKPGLGLALDEQHKLIWDSVFPWIKRARSTDVSGWDWNVKLWLIHLCAASHVAQFNLRPDSPYLVVVRNWVHCYANSIWSTSDGVLLVLRDPGVVKSGSYVTASWNSRMRVICGYIIGVENIIAMGDDAVETEVPDMMAKYQALGLRVKAVKEFDGESFSFCSHTFKSGVAIPENIAKSFYNLLSNPLEESYLEQFKFENRNSPHLARYLAVYEQVVGSLGVVVT